MNKTDTHILKRHKKLIPPLLLAMLCIHTIWRAITGKLTIGDTGHIGALTATALCIISYFFLPKAYNYILAASLILGIGNVISFYQVWASLSIGTGAMHISIQPLLLAIALLCFFLWTNPGKKQQEIHLNTDKTEELYARYRQYDTAALEQIVNGQRYTNEAITAARIVLQERTNTNTGIA